MGTILISPNRETTDGPIVFLAGPVSGAPDWQSDAIGLLSLNELVNIVSPRQARDESVPLPHSAHGKQIEWEQFYMMSAVQSGVVLFWFPKPLAGTGSLLFAQQSFFELGDILARSNSELAVALGIEDGFPNADYFIETLKQKYPNLTVRSSLSDVCDETLRLIRTQYI